MTMIPVDNFDKIRSLLKFDNEDNFYFLQILQRKKDHTKGKVNGTNNNSRLVKVYYIKNLAYFDFIKPEVIELCKIFNARASINLNRRSFKQLAFEMLRKVTEQILNKSYDTVQKAYATIAGTYQKENDKSWIIDIDEPMSRKHNDLILFIERECEPIGDKFIKVIPSKSGAHIITKPFNTEKFKQKYPAIEIHKNNPTNLYIP